MRRLRTLRRFGHAILLFFGLALICQPAAAQSVALRGTVKDATGALIENATVQSYQGETLAGSTTTNDDGAFTLSLPPGEYRIEVTALNFAAYAETVAVRQGIDPLAIQLQLAPILQSLDVADEPYQISLEPDRNLTGLVLDEQAVEELPEDEEELAQLLRDLAGPGADAVGGAEIFTDGFTGGRLPPRDQIREIRINNNPFSAESSRQGRGRIEIITRAGSDALRGSFGFQFRDEALNARNAFADVKPPYQRRNWRSNLSGPLLREKMSFSLFAMRSDSEDSDSILATTLAGPVSSAVVRPNHRQEYNGRIQYNLPKNHFMNLSLEYGTDSRENEGVGGFTLPERATESHSKDFNLQIRETAPISERLVHETRFAFSRDRSSTLPVNSAVAVNVLDAFQGGGGTRYSEQTERNYQFGNQLSYSRGALSLKTGFQGNFRQYATLSRENFLGTFVFSDLAAYAAGRPITFTINSGNPLLDMNQLEAATFLQSDYRVSTTLMLSAGVRYEAQAHIGDRNNFDPRFGFAYGLGQSVIRGGIGLFHQRLNAGTVQSLMRLDGTRQIQTVVQYCQEGELPDSGCFQPSYPDPFAAGAAGVARPPASIREAPDDLALPYTINSSISFETRLPRGLFVSASYDFVRGLHLYRSRNINAPLPGETERLDPARGNILLLESSASSRYHDLSFRVNQRIGNASVNFNYTLASGHNDADGTFSLPANNYDLSGEWGRSGEDQRHSVFGGFNFQLPWRITANTRLRANSGRPFNITTGQDDNNDSNTNDRPIGVARNTGEGPGAFTMDLSFRKTFSLKRGNSTQAVNAPAGATRFQQGPGDWRGPGGPGGPFPGGPGGGPGGGQGNRERRGLEMSVTANISNLLNHTNFSRYSGVMTSPFFGRANSARAPREIELGVQFSF